MQNFVTVTLVLALSLYSGGKLIDDSDLFGVPENKFYQCTESAVPKVKVPVKSPPKTANGIGSGPNGANTPSGSLYISILVRIWGEMGWIAFCQLPRLTSAKISIEGCNDWRWNWLRCLCLQSYPFLHGQPVRVSFPYPCLHCYFQLSWGWHHVADWLRCSANLLGEETCFLLLWNHSAVLPAWPMILTASLVFLRVWLPSRHFLLRPWEVGSLLLVLLVLIWWFRFRVSIHAIMIWPHLMYKQCLHVLEPTFHQQPPFLLGQGACRIKSFE